MPTPTHTSPSRTTARAMRWLMALAAAFALLGFGGPMFAAQFLINPGDDWQAKAAKLRPGDELVLMPGKHRGVTLDRLVGTAQAPIVIRGASAEKPSVIGAQLDGIRIKEAAHIVIKDLQIIGGSASGIWLAADQGADGASAEPSAAPPPAIPDVATEPETRSVRARDVYIDNVSISKVGPRGQRHGVFLCGFADVRINRLRVEGWGGSAIELVACEDVSINRSAFRGVKDHSQYCGIRARAGTDRVSITDARFENAGDIAISLGAKSNPEDFVPPLPADAPNASVYEAARVTLDQVTIVGSLCPVAFIHAFDCVVRNTSILLPRRCVIALLNQSPDVRIAPTGRNIFGNNLIVWNPGDVTKLAEVDEGANAAEFIAETNLWWAPITPEQRSKLGPLPGANPAQQLHDIDPQLDAKGKPQATAARSFGARM